MPHSARGRDLAPEPIVPERGRQLGAQHLHRHRSLVSEVLGQKNGCHPTRTDLTFEAITIRQRHRQSRINHGGIVPAASRRRNRQRQLPAAIAGGSVVRALRGPDYLSPVRTSRLGTCPSATSPPESRMKKKHNTAVPDFSRKRPVPGTPTTAVGEKSSQPSPRQPQKPPTTAKNGGRRGT